MTVERWEYDCPFVNPRTGERRVVVVELTPAEREDAIWHFKLRGPNGPGGPKGPIVKGYAWRRAAQSVPSDFVPIVEGIKQRIPPTVH